MPDKPNSREGKLPKSVAEAIPVLMAPYANDPKQIQRALQAILDYQPSSRAPSEAAPSPSKPSATQNISIQGQLAVLEAERRAASVPSRQIPLSPRPAAGSKSPRSKPTVSDPLGISKAFQPPTQVKGPTLVEDPLSFVWKHFPKPTAGARPTLVKPGDEHGVITGKRDPISVTEEKTFLWPDSLEAAMFKLDKATGFRLRDAARAKERGLFRQYLFYAGGGGDRVDPTVLKNAILMATRPTVSGLQAIQRAVSNARLAGATGADVMGMLPVSVPDVFAAAPNRRPVPTRTGALISYGLAERFLRDIFGRSGIPESGFSSEFGYYTAAQAQADAKRQAEEEQRQWEAENTQHGHLASDLRQIKDDPNIGRKLLAVLALLPHGIGSAYEQISDKAMRASEWAQGASRAREDPDYRRRAELFSAQTGQLSSTGVMLAGGAMNPNLALALFKAQLAGDGLAIAHDLVAGSPDKAWDFVKEQAKGFIASNDPFENNPNLTPADRIERSANFILSVFGLAQGARNAGRNASRWKQNATAIENSIRSGTVYRDLIRVRPDLLHLPKEMRQLLYLGSKKLSNQKRSWQDIPPEPPPDQAPPPPGGVNDSVKQGSQSGALFDDPVLQARYEAARIKHQKRGPNGSLDWLHPTGIEWQGGYPQFGRHAVFDVVIEPTGNRRRDIKRAMQMIKEMPQLDGKYVWHHHEDWGRLQLVPWDVHTAVGHHGGFVIYEEVFK